MVAGNRATTGGGIAVPDGATLALIDVEVRENEAQTTGGGITAGPGSTIDLGASIVARNEAAGSGGGVFLSGADLVGGEVTENRSTAAGYSVLTDTSGPSGGGVHATGASKIVGTDVHANLAVVGSGVGVMDGVVELVDVVVRDNIGADFGGAGIHAARADLTLAGTSEVSNNATPRSGGGLSAWESTVAGGVYQNNDASEGTGGGVLLGDSLLVDATVTNNVALDGGGVGLWDGSTVSGCTITGNTASRSGGGVDARAGDEGRVEDSEISDNLANDGGGISVEGLHLSLDDVTILRNEANTDAGGISVGEDATVEAADCDLGEDTDDNAPSDVAVDAGASYAYGLASFACDASACETL